MLGCGPCRKVHGTSSRVKLDVPKLGSDRTNARRNGRRGSAGTVGTVGFPRRFQKTASLQGWGTRKERALNSFPHPAHGPHCRREDNGFLCRAVPPILPPLE